MKPVIRPEPWPLDEPHPPAEDAPPLLLVVVLVAAVVGVVVLAALGALGSNLDDTRQRSPLPTPAYTVLAPVTAAP